jgi:pimeloyl-ACP methyl ester carboxylesterase
MIGEPERTDSPLGDETVEEAVKPDFLVRGKNGTMLAGQCWGDPAGRPVVLMHGMPGSRLGPRPRGRVLERLGVRLISYDRPGYGLSDRRPGRTIAESADDVTRIADHLGLDRFAVVGRSGGGPHALGSAAMLRGRVDRVALLVSSAPPDASGLRWEEGLADVNADDFADVERSVATAPVGTVAEDVGLSSRAELIRQDPETLIRMLLPELAASDRRVVEDRAMRNLLTESYREAVRQGAAGWIDDIVALRSPWDFKFDEVECPVLLWHGGDDRFSPPEHTRWMANELRASRDTEEKKAAVQFRIERGLAHFAAFEIFTEVLGWLIEPVAAPQAPVPARTAAGPALDGFSVLPAAPPHSGALDRPRQPVAR